MKDFRFLAIIVLALVALLGAALLPPPVAHAQFIDRIVRGCSAGATPQASVIVNPSNSGNVTITTCTGGSVTINGTAVVPGTPAPVNATYVTQTPNATLTNEQPLSALATGIMFSTTVTGVVTSLGPDLPFANLTPATAASKLLGRGSAAGAGDYQEVTLGSGLTMTGTTLSAAGGVTCAGCTSGTLPYFDGANLADSPITRPSATHLQIFTNGAGGADFDSSAPSINLNGTGAPVTIGGATTLLTVDDSAAQALTATAASTTLSVDGNGAAVIITGGDLLPGAAAGMYIGAASLPIGAVFIGNAANNSSQITGTFTGNRVATLPDKTGTFAFMSDLTSSIAAFYQSGTPFIAGNGTLNTGSKDSAGKVTATATGASTIVLTFSAAFARAPACIVTNETTSNLVRPVSTTTTLTVAATIVNGDSIAYVCLEY